MEIKSHLKYILPNTYLISPEYLAEISDIITRVSLQPYSFTRISKAFQQKLYKVFFAGHLHFSLQRTKEQ